jgi:hypothetical protein
MFLLRYIGCLAVPPRLRVLRERKGYWLFENSVPAKNSALSEKFVRYLEKHESRI